MCSSDLELGGRDLATLKGRDAVRIHRDVQMMFQDSYAAMDPRMRIDQILAEPMSIQKTGNSRQIAEISAGDEAIGKLIADVMEKIGPNGVVTVEEGRGLELESEVVEGFTVQRGFVSPYMVTDAKRMEAVYDKPAIVVTDKKVSSAQEFVPLLEMIAQTGKKDLVLIADDVDGEALSLLVLNRLKGAFNTLAIKAPSDKDVLYSVDRKSVV